MVENHVTRDCSPSSSATSEIYSVPTQKHISITHTCYNAQVYYINNTHIMNECNACYAKKDRKGRGGVIRNYFLAGLCQLHPPATGQPRTLCNVTCTSTPFSHLVHHSDCCTTLFSAYSSHSSPTAPPPSPPPPSECTAKHRVPRTPTHSYYKPHLSLFLLFSSPDTQHGCLL